MEEQEIIRWVTIRGKHFPIVRDENGNEVLGTGVELNKQNQDGSIMMSYVHIKNKAPKIKNMDFGQDIEPAGEYMNMDTTQGKNKIDHPDYEYGTIHFKKLLVLEHKSTDSKGWKKDLSDMFGGKKGKALSNAITKAGYDAVMTWEMFRGNKEWSEIVNLKGNKL